MEHLQRTQYQSVAGYAMERRHWKVVLFIGIAFHALAAFMMPLGLDAHVHSTYVTDEMNDGEGHLEWGKLRQDSNQGSVPEETSSNDRWFAWHLLIQLWFTIFGASIGVLHVLSFMIGLGCLSTIYLSTKYLFEEERALHITALASIYPPLIRATGRFYQESAILMIVTIAMCCVIKALQNTSDYKWWIFPSLSVFVVASFKGMPLWMPLVAIIGFFIFQRVSLNIVAYVVAAVCVELFVVYRNGVSPMTIDIVLAFAASTLGAVIFLYAAVLLAKPSPEIRNKDALILQKGTHLALASLVGWVAGLWVSEAALSGTGLIETILVLRNNPRYLTLLFVPLLYIRFLNDPSYRLISEKNKRIAYVFLAGMIAINIAVLSLATGERGTEQIGEQLNAEIEEGQDILFLSDSTLAMHRMYTMHLTLDPQNDKSNTAIWRTTASGWETELQQCEALRDVHWIVVDYTGLDELPEGWNVIEIDSQSTINEGYRLFEWSGESTRCI
jgi:hypothetical protein